LTGWNHASFNSVSSQIDRLLERGDLSGAHHAAQALLQRCLAAGEAAYPEAAYDLAMAHFHLGRTTMESGRCRSRLAAAERSAAAF
jgi:hypothetical protein